MGCSAIEEEEEEEERQCVFCRIITEFLNII
jgi:hypothetical protein